MSGPFGAGALQLFSGAGDFYSFQPTGSLRFEDGDVPQLTRTPASAGNRRTFTFSCWVKRGNLGEQVILSAYSDDSNRTRLMIDSGNRFQFFTRLSGNSHNLVSTAIRRDHSSWYHVVFEVDTTQSTASNRVKIYVNGEEQTFLSTDFPDQNEDTFINHTVEHTIGNGQDGGSREAYFDGYLSEIYLIDGTALDKDSFAQDKNGIWIPKDAKSSLTFGTNGFYLPFNSTVTATGQSTVLYTGTGANRSVEGFGYKPDFVWIKSRDTAYDHHLFDRVRGGSNSIYSNDKVVENTYQTNVTFTSDGFFAAKGSGTPQIYLNKSADDFVAWAFDAGADQTATGYGCALYRGSGEIQTIADIGFSPDLVWIKARDVAYNHRMFDSVRGPSKRLQSNTTAAEADEDGVISFDNDGMTVEHAGTNNSGNTFAAWCWDAGDSAPASNSNGTIASTVKASTANGFSVVTYTGNATAGATVGHGLSSTPEMYMVKSTSLTTGWVVYHKDAASSPEDGYMSLNGTDAFFDTITWNDTAPTSSVFSLGPTGYSSNNSGATYVAYCWHSVSGYSKIGSYTGNGSATGPTITCGFRPAFVMIKRTDSTGSWYIFDVNRDPDNKGQRYIRPNADSTEGGSGTGQEYIDFQSNGFQIIASGSDFGDGNTSSANYIYMAFAGGLDTIAPVNTDGSVTSRVKASDDTGFSVVRYEGLGNTTNQTIGVGLNWSSKNKVVFTKNLDDATYNWGVNSNLLGSNKVLSLNTTNNDSQENSSHYITYGTNTFTTYNGSNILNLNDNYIAYCFAETSGKSKFGTYTGTGSSGKAITGLGFRPALIIIKSYDETRNWVIVDDKRGGSVGHLHPSSTAAEQTGEDEVQFDSDGFTLLSGDADSNYNNFNYLYMAFADGQDASFFHDESGQRNNFKPEHIHAVDVVPDNSTNNFAVINSLASLGTESEGNLKTVTTTSGYGSVVASVGNKTGKWYWEVIPVSNVNGAPFIGVVDETYDSVNSGSAVGYLLSGGKDSIGYYTNGSSYVNGTGNTSYGDSYAGDDIISVALNLDDNEITFYKNGESQGAISHTFSGNHILPAVSDGTNSASQTFAFNFGQDSSFAGTKAAQGNTDENGHGDFYFSVPSGFLALCTANFPDPGIDPSVGGNPEKNFNTRLFNGNAGTQSITGVGFQPQWLWIKRRDSSPTEHALFDIVRGAGKSLKSNNAVAEQTQSDSVTSLDSDGFSLGDNTEAGPDVNYTDGGSYVSWNWLAGGSASSNSNGSITSSVSANTEAGFSIVGYTGNATAGATIGHGLSQAPEYVIWKNRSSGVNWIVQADPMGSPSGGNIALLNSADAVYANSSFNTTFGSSTITLDSGSNYNGNGNNIIAYCFHSVEGYSKIGSYTGNGSTDGTFVYTGFRPAFLLVKRIQASSNGWYIYDNKRNNFGTLVDVQLYANLTSADDDGNRDLDFTSNGFKPRLTDVNVNASGGTYFYLAFAEQPFKYANAR